MAPVVSGGDLRATVTRMQTDYKIKFQKLVQLDAQVQHLQLDHDFLKKKRFEFELNYTNQINSVKNNQTALEQTLHRTRQTVIAKLEEPNTLRPDPATEKAINDLKRISFNHLAPLLDNLLNLSKEND